MTESQNYMVGSSHTIPDAHGDPTHFRNPANAPKRAFVATIEVPVHALQSLLDFWSEWNDTEDVLTDQNITDVESAFDEATEAAHLVRHLLQGNE